MVWHGSMAEQKFLKAPPSLSSCTQYTQRTFRVRRQASNSRYSRTMIPRCIIVHGTKIKLSSTSRGPAMTWFNGSERRGSRSNQAIAPHSTRPLSCQDMSHAVGTPACCAAAFDESVKAFQLIALADLSFFQWDFFNGFQPHTTRVRRRADVRYPELLAGTDARGLTAAARLTLRGTPHTRIRAEPDTTERGSKEHCHAVTH
ncbi:hypothetical protein EVAR_32107_1 [Eumeta japonica]|uniref:Uncharacterized protein n=1 Tax=Eumeta variegata TaxID=151549 RepID=A0A4C1V4U6_EUMVA|nr:hypothetical protein EVAR_32107_1 [Eumeta japonica]